MKNRGRRKMGMGRGRDYGFTIVELLIVVVVIAILATITIVSYNGITNRAESARYATTAKTIEKAVLTTEAMADIKPIFEAGSIFSCWGNPADYPATPDFSAGACYREYGMELTADVATWSALKSIDASIPSFAGLKVMRLGDVKSRGVIYYYSAYEKTITLQWLTPDASGCAGAESGNMRQAYADQIALFQQLLPIFLAAQAGTITYANANSQVAAIQPDYTTLSSANIAGEISRAQMFVNMPSTATVCTRSVQL